MTSKIEWTDETWNPVIGCSHISAGCENCYAEKMAIRLMNMECRGYINKDVVRNSTGWTGKTAFVESALHKPLHWRKPRRIFVCSMGDLFHDSVPFEWVDQVLAIAWQCPQHTFQILTKRPKRMAQYFSPENLRYSARKIADLLPPGTFGTFDCDMNWPMENLWLGVTAENQKTADYRIPELLLIPAAVRFVSVEPMLGPVDLRRLDYDKGVIGIDSLAGTCGVYQLDNAECPRLDWVICGGESGPGARPMDPDWVRSLRDQCGEAETPFFFKQWGHWCHLEQMPDDTFAQIDASDNSPTAPSDYKKPWGIGKKAAGKELDGQIWHQFPTPATDS